MENKSSRITAAAYRAFDTASELTSHTESHLRADDSVVLVGSDASLDSMAFVNFIVQFEEELERELGSPVSVTEILNAVDPSDGSPLTLGRVVSMLTERLA